MKVKATYVSVWDGNVEIRTKCEFDTETKNVTDVESADDVEDLDILFEEYIELPTGEIIKTFTVGDERIIIEGKLQE